MKTQLTLSLATVAALTLIGGLSGCNTKSKEAARTTASGPAGTVPSHGAAASATLSGLTYTAPSEWIAETPSSTMRKSQYRLPKVDGDSEDAEMAVFSFGSGGGSPQDNINRWIGQFQNANGSPANGTVAHREIHGMAVSTVDVSGTYLATGGPMMTQTTPKAGFRMLAAVVETPVGPWFFKLTGPAKTVAKWAQSFQSFIDTIQ